MIPSGHPTSAAVPPIPDPVPKVPPPQAQTSQELPAIVPKPKAAAHTSSLWWGFHALVKPLLSTNPTSPTHVAASVPSCHSLGHLQRGSHSSKVRQPRRALPHLPAGSSLESSQDAKPDHPWVPASHRLLGTLLRPQNHFWHLRFRHPVSSPSPPCVAPRVLSTQPRGATSSVAALSAVPPMPQVTAAFQWPALALPSHGASEVTSSFWAVFSVLATLGILALCSPT